MLKAIIFDIDGVLADSRTAIMSNTKILLEEHGFSVNDTDLEKVSSSHSTESALFFLAPQLEHDKKLLREMLLRLSVLTAQNLSLIHPTSIVAQIPTLSNKYKLAAASNRKSSAEMVLETLGILPYFQVVMTSAIAPAKPNPKMIELALQKLGVAPNEAVFLGDNKEDELAGKAAGVPFFLIDGTKENEWKKFKEKFLTVPD